MGEKIECAALRCNSELMRSCTGKGKLLMNFDHGVTVLLLNEIRNDVQVLSSGEALNNNYGTHDLGIFNALSMLIL